MSLKCSALYLAQFRLTSPHLLAGGDGTKTATIIGDVYIHPSAKVHPTAKVESYLTVSLRFINSLYVLKYKTVVGPPPINLSFWENW